MRKLKHIPVIFLLVILSGCDTMTFDMDVPNYNSPNLDQVYANVEDYPSLLSGAYNSWWNHSIGTSPQFALMPAAEVMGTGYGSWGAGPFYAIPREPVPNTDGDIVLFPQSAGWFGFYQAIPTVNNIMKRLTIEGLEVIVGNDNHTNSTLAHGYLLQGILYGHLAMLYDNAFLITEADDPLTFEFEFTNYQSLMDFAIGRIEKAIEICNTTTFTDPVPMLPEVRFDNVSLGKFANSYAARLLAYNARNAEQTTTANWAKILQFAQNGIDDDFKVRIIDEWRGRVISRDPWGYHQLVMNWGWVRVNQRIINMMAPDHPNAAYPWPFGEPALGPVESPDNRFDEYFLFNESIAWAGSAATRGYQVMTHYSFRRFAELYDQGVGYINFFSKAENDLLIAEALIRTGGSVAQAVEIINETRVGKGGLDPLQAGDPIETIKQKLYYERFVETLMTYPLGGYFDRRRTDVEGMGLRPGTVRQFPVPYQELKVHGMDVYTFGGEGNEM